MFFVLLMLYFGASFLLVDSLKGTNWFLKKANILTKHTFLLFPHAYIPTQAFVTRLYTIVLPQALPVPA